MSRPPESEPECLKDPELERYHQLTGPERQTIRDRLIELQHECCAYCERPVSRDRDDGHIEHLCRQTDYPDREVKWSNLFFSCMDPRTCGKAKDDRLATLKDAARRREKNENVLAPDAVDVDRFLRFLDDGKVIVRDTLSPEDAVRAATTIELFNLNNASLVTGRRKAVGFLTEIIDSLSDFGADMVLAFAREQREKSVRAMYASPIRQFLDAVIGT